MTQNNIENVQARFDRAAAGWEADPGRVALAKAVVAAIRQAVPLRADLRTLDFGAGTGLVTLGLLPYVGHVTAVDASREMLRVLAGKLQALQIANVSTLCCDIAQAALPAAAFDLIVSSMVLHHIPDVPRALQRLRPALRPGGWIALADLDAEDGTFHADTTGVFHHGFDREEVRGWLHAAGCVETAARTAHQIVRPAADGQLHTYPVFLVTGRLL